MRVVVTGATGNVGTSLMHLLTGEPEAESIVGIARRRPELRLPRTSWCAAIAADPLLDAQAIARLLDARLLKMSPRRARQALNALWHLHLQPSPPGWLDLALAVPIMDTTAARERLERAPGWAADDALRELLEGLRAGDGEETPPLAPGTSGKFRLRELATGIGRRGGAS